MTIEDLEEALRRLETAAADEEARAFAALNEAELELLDRIAREGTRN